MFDDLGVDIMPPSEAPGFFKDELKHYLSTDIETTTDGPLKWWCSKQEIYPRLSRMALNYLSIPGMKASIVVSDIELTNQHLSATSIDVERVFSRGRLILSHVRNRLSVETTHAIMCLGAWSQMNLITSNDVLAVIKGGKEDDDDSNAEDSRIAHYVDQVL